MEIDKGLLGGSTVLMLLALLRERDRYGYEIIKELRERSDSTFEFKEGTLYPVLHRMENAGLVKSYRHGAENGKTRKYYRITAAGGGTPRKRETTMGYLCPLGQQGNRRWKPCLRLKLTILRIGLSGT